MEVVVIYSTDKKAHVDEFPYAVQCKWKPLEEERR